MTRLILLAAGSARRFGSNKLMWELDGKPMIGHVLAKLSALHETRGWEVMLVTREGPVAEMAAEYPVDVVINPDPERGISSSIICALESIGEDADSAVFFVADQPWLTIETIEGFIDGYLASGLKCGCVTHNGETGNPCAFSSELFSELMKLSGDRGGKKVLMQHQDSCWYYEVSDAKELADIDTRQ